MKIVHVTPSYAPSVGGVELFVRQVSERLHGRGHDVSVITSNGVFAGADRGPVMPVGQSLVDGVRVRRLRHWALLNRFFHRLDRMRGGNRLSRIIYGDWSTFVELEPFVVGMARHIVREKPDIVAAFMPFSTVGFQCALAKQRAGLPLVAIPCLHVKQDQSVQVAIRVMAKMADAVLPLTEFERGFLVANGIEARRTHVVGAGVDPASAEGADGESFRAAHGLGKRPVVTYVGRKSASKGLYFLLDAMEAVWASRPDVCLVMAGARLAFTEQLDGRIASLATACPNRIVSIDNFPEEERKNILAASDLVVKPSREESFGIIFLEAWLQGKPVVGCSDAAPQEVVSHGKDGLLVPYGCTKALADAILQLVNDAPLREAMGHAGKKKVMTAFTWEHVVDRILKAYETVVATVHEEASARTDTRSKRNSI